MVITTVELQWLEHLWNNEKMFETGVVRANECIFLISLLLKVYCVSSLESPHRGDVHTIYHFQYKKKSPLAATGFFPRSTRTSSKQMW